MGDSVAGVPSVVVLTSLTPMELIIRQKIHFGFQLGAPNRIGILDQGLECRILLLQVTNVRVPQKRLERNSQRVCDHLKREWIFCSFPVFNARQVHFQYRDVSWRSSSRRPCFSQPFQQRADRFSQQSVNHEAVLLCDGTGQSKDGRVARRGACQYNPA